MKMSMKKWMGEITVALIIVNSSYATVIVNEQFNYADGSLTTISSWTGGSATVTGGVVSITAGGAQNFSLALGNTYAVNPSESGADFNVGELWFCLNAKITAGSVRIGLGSSSSVIQVDKYASVQMNYADPLQVQAMVNGSTSSSTVSYNDEFVPIYGRITAGTGTNLVLSVWFNPTDVTDLGSSVATVTKTYVVDSQLVDMIGIASWNTKDIQIDSVTVGTTLSDVVPEPATLGLFMVSGITCVFVRKLHF